MGKRKPPRDYSDRNRAIWEKDPNKGSGQPAKPITCGPKGHRFSAHPMKVRPDLRGMNGGYR